MNALEAAHLIDRCIALGIWNNPGDADMLATQAETWGEQLASVPLGFAIEEVDRWTGPYKIRPGQIRGAYETVTKAAKQHITYDERACAFARLCRCDHEIGNCNRGFLDRDSDRDRGTVRWCPRCWDARNLKREEEGKEPIEIGVTGSHL